MMMMMMMMMEGGWALERADKATEGTGKKGGGRRRHSCSRSASKLRSYGRCGKTYEGPGAGSSGKK